MPMPEKSTGGSPQRMAGKTRQLSPKAAKSMADLAREADSNTGHGVMVFVLRDPSTLPYVRTLVEKRALNGQAIADRSLPSPTSLIALYGGAATHESAMASVLHEATKGSEPVDARYRIEPVGIARAINCLSTEGMHILHSHVNRGGCVTVAQSLSKKQQEDAKEVLIRLEEQAEKEDVVILLFLTCTDGHPESWLIDYCREVFVVDAYEPEPDASFGFSISSMQLEQSHSLGVGKIACDVTVADKRIRHRWTDFVAATLEARAMFYLQQEGLSLREIGDLLGLDDHVQVWRKLKDITRHVTVHPPADWRAKYFDCLGLDLDASDDRTDDETLTEDATESWDDDSSPPTPAKPVRATRI